MVSIFGHQTPLQVTDVPVAVLVILACSAIGVYGIVLGGWASGSTYPLLGGLRSSAQMISYEITMGLSIVAVFITAGTMSTSGIVAAQAGGGEASWDILGWHPTVPSWYALLLIPSFLIFFVAAFGETNRAPFDLPEAESELVAGYMTEYSSIKFLLYMLSEYVAMVSMSAAMVTMFLGGWRAPWPITAFWSGANEGWIPLIWFVGKIVLMLFVFVWVRATLPRLRYDQFMRLGWKVLLPINLVWLLAVAGLKVMRSEQVSANTRWLIIARRRARHHAGRAAVAVEEGAQPYPGRAGRRPTGRKLPGATAGPAGATESAGQAGGRGAAAGQRRRRRATSTAMIDVATEEKEV